MLVNNRYKIIKDLGHGGMGSVYLVKDILKDDMLFALKTISMDAVKKYTNNGIISFKKEYDIMTNLKHPNLTRLYDFGEHENEYYIILEYLEGVLLSELSLKNDSLKIDIIVQILRALEYIHSRNIIYRDLKPGNIMVINNFVKLLDFGLSDYFEAIQEEIMGSFYYMSPDNFTGEVDHTSDIFSLGIVFFELISDRRYYKKCTDRRKTIPFLLRDAELFSKYQKERLNCLKNDGIRTIICKMTSFYKKNRYTDCADIIYDINQYTGSTHDYETIETRESYVLGNPFIDRKEEFSKIKTVLFSQAEKKLFFWSGVAGIGKSRLFKEFKKYCRLNDVPFYGAACIEGELGEYYVLREMLSQMITNATKTLIDKYGKYLRLILPCMHQLQAYEAAIIANDPKLMKDIIIQNISDFVIEFSSHSKFRTILFIDDIEWIDSGSTDIIRNTLYKADLAHEKGQKVLIFACYNPINLKAGSPASDLLSTSHAMSFELQSLDINGTQEYIESIFGARYLDKTINKNIRDIRDIVGGNPMFLNELIRSLVDRELIIRDKKYWRLKKPVTKDSIPESLIDLTKARVSNLLTDNTQKEILQILSFIRTDINIELLNHIFRKLSISEGARIIHELENKEIINHSGNEKTPSYTFSSSLVKEIIRNQTEDKASISLFIAETLESFGPQKDDHYEEIAYHYHQGNNIPKAVTYYEKCGDKAKEGYFNHKALKYYDNAIALMKGHGLHYIEMEISIRLKTGTIFYLLGKWDKAKNAYSCCIYLAEKEKIKKILAEAYLMLGNLLRSMGNIKEASNHYKASKTIYEEIDDNEGICIILGNEGIIYYQTGKYQKALECYEKCLDIAEKTQIKRDIARANGNIAIVYFLMGKYQKALKHNEIYCNLSRDAGDRLGIAISMGHMGLIYAKMGDYSKAMEYLKKNKNISEEIGYKHGVGTASGNIGNLYYIQKDFDKALKYYNIKKKVSLEIGDKPGIGIASGQIGLILTAQGKYEEAIHHFETEEKTFIETEDTRGLQIVAGHKGEAFQLSGQYSKALKYFTKQKEISEQLGDKTDILTANGNIGCIYYDMKQFENALDYINKSTEGLKKLNPTDSILIKFLLIESMILFYQGNHKEAENIVKEALSLAKDQQNTTYINKALVQKYYLEAFLNSDQSIVKLFEMLESPVDTETRAEIFYTLYRIKNSDNYKTDAIHLYDKLYKKNKQYKYAEILKELRC